jgi:glycerol-3-phosphate dehydrogenase (NAD(P)+)
MMLEPVAIAGNGGWGTALAIVLAHKGVPVRLWGIEPDYVRETAATRLSPKYLPGIPIPAAVAISPDFAEASRDARLVISAIPTQYLRETWAALAPLDGSGGAPILSLSKGIEVGTLQRPTQILRERFPRRGLAALMGPSHAEEVGRGMPAAVVAASTDEDLAREVQGTLSCDRFRVYTNGDLTGVEISSALKNVIALAAGISDGLGFGDNAKAALLTRGMVEIARLGVAMGANRQTFAGLAGIGDLITTCVSRHGRNRAVGERIGRGEKLDDILASMAMVAEGVPTTKAARALAKKHDLDMPITEEVYRVLFTGQSPREAVTSLMLRRHRGESEEYR